MKKIDNFVNLYPVTKTLRFKLVPIGKTKENFDAAKLLDADKERAENYKKAKIIIDKYYNEFINNCLNNFKFNTSPDNLNAYYEVQNSSIDKNEKTKKIKELQGKLRKEIVSSFSNTESKKKIYDKLFKGELLNQILDDKRITTEEKEVISKFDRFTTYFQGFFQNRKNIFSDEDKAGSISYRCINENLNIFVNNIKVYLKAKDVLSDDIKELETEYNKVLGDLKIRDIFSLEYYNLCLTGEDINKYNIIISGFAEDEKNKVRGLNEYIDLYNQKHKGDKEHRQLPKFKQLYKQILSNDKTQTFRFDVIEKDEEVYYTIDTLVNLFDNDNNVLENVKNVFELVQEHCFDSEKVYLSADKFPYLSTKCFDNYNIINISLSDDYDKNHKLGAKKISYEKEKEKYLKSIKYLSLENICNLIEETEHSKDRLFEILNNEFTSNILGINNALNAYKKINRNENIRGNSTIIESIKNLLDSLLRLYNFKESFYKFDEAEDIDLAFYGTLSELDPLKDITSIYNKVRNYLTKKPYKTDKIKLTFNKPNLMNGWVDSKTDKSDNGTQYSGYLFRKLNVLNEYDYYLGISEDVRLFRQDLVKEQKDTFGFERLDYYQIKADTIYGKAFKDSSNEKRFDNLKNILLNNNRIPSKKRLLVNKCKDLNELKNVTDSIIQEKIFNYYNVSSEELEKVQNRDEKPLYLFKITNKDLSFCDNREKRKSRGRENLHTMYFKALMSGEQGTYDLGSGEIFYREANKKGDKYVVHKANEGINNKNEETKKRKKQSVFKYDIVKDKRYYEEQFQFHLSTTINYKTDDIKDKEFNTNVNNNILCCDDNYVIGIDRGERNLIYINVVSEKKGLVEQLSLNDIINEYNGNTYSTNYHDLLEVKEKERADAKKSWNSIANIKELKEGYVSQVVHKICELVEKYDAIIVMEDLNAGFKNRRVKVEKQVYQKFEKMLIDKLNLYINKQYEANQIGGLLNGFQLTRPYQGDKKMVFQNGFIYYIGPWNTSKIDPTTGFVNLFRLANYQSMKARKTFISKFDSIMYNQEEDVFEFSFDYKNFDYGSIDYIGKWTISSFGKRILTYRNKDKNSNWDNKDIEPTEELKKLFKENSIDYINSVDLKSEILQINKDDFFKNLFNIIKLILQMRNSKTNTDIDYLISPVKNKSGKHYNSDETKKKGDNLPFDADSNGAFNIARKGLMIIDRIKRGETNKLTIINNEEWLEYAQTHLPI